MFCIWDFHIGINSENSLPVRLEQPVIMIQSMIYTTNRIEQL